MDLFDTRQERVLVKDAEGGIRYVAGLIDPETTSAWMRALDQADWTSQTRKMYDRQVLVPRMTAVYATANLTDHLPLATMLKRVQQHIAAPFTHIGLNLYRDGRDSVAMHNDKLPTIVKGQPIALLSLGGTRRMRIRSKADHSDAFSVDLEHGSLLTMSYASQITHEHGIPKTVKHVGARISAVFRVRP